MDASDAKKVLRSRRRTSSERVEKPALLSTGSTLLNLNLSGDWRGGLVKGKYFFFVGDTSSGKTFLTLTCFAEAAANPAFSEYRLIHDNVEHGALMDFERFFGPTAANRIEPPSMDGGEPVFSSTIEEFYFNVDDALKKDVPFIYVLDSMDALSSRYEGKKFDEKKKALRKGAEPTGDYGDGKAKLNSSGLRALLPRIEKSGSILIIINQTRDNIDGGLYAPAKTRSGGHALSFYACVEMWTSVAGKLKRSVRGKDREVGVQSKVSIKKNRISGRTRTCVIPIKYDYGIDDLGSCIDFMLSEGFWKKTGEGSGTRIDVKGAMGIELPMKVKELVAWIEENQLENDLRKAVSVAWHELELACTEKRKPRYQ